MIVRVMRTSLKTLAMTRYMFRGLIRDFEGFNRVRIVRTVGVSIYRRGPIQPYLGHEVRTAKEPKESYYNLETWD
jgi:hypothetical protein